MPKDWSLRIELTKDQKHILFVTHCINECFVSLSNKVSVGAAAVENNLKTFQAHWLITKEEICRTRRVVFTDNKEAHPLEKGLEKWKILAKNNRSYSDGLRIIGVQVTLE